MMLPWHPTHKIQFALATERIELTLPAERMEFRDKNEAKAFPASKDRTLLNATTEKAATAEKAEK